jgi:hypothetical protein
MTNDTNECHKNGDAMFTGCQATYYKEISSKISRKTDLGGPQPKRFELFLYQGMGLTDLNILRKKKIP